MKRMNLWKSLLSIPILTIGAYEVKVESYDGRDGVTEVSAGSIVVN